MSKDEPKCADCESESALLIITVSAVSAVSIHKDDDISLDVVDNGVSGGSFIKFSDSQSAVAVIFASRKSVWIILDAGFE